MAAAHLTKYKVGDLVWKAVVGRSGKGPGGVVVPPKLQANWEGPFQVTQGSKF